VVETNKPIDQMKEIFEARRYPQFATETVPVPAVELVWADPRTISTVTSVPCSSLPFCFSHRKGRPPFRYERQMLSPTPDLLGRAAGGSVIKCCQ
jgi:hypothetical protein